ncbi:MAG: hypothetical protein RBU21_15420 [FCB group bacterium]|jgi:hypothetical protein|nr:hypothetical protein [FCB group bacterium]
MSEVLSALTARRSVVAVLAMAFCVLALPAFAADEAAPAPAGDKEAIKIELPQPAFGGTPLNYFGPNLEPQSFKKRPPFMAPKGAVNLAKGKTVTASSDTTMGKLEQITDGDKEAYEKGVVELKPGKQWVQVDLGAKSEIFAVLMWHFFAYDRVYFDVVVQVSDDPEFAKDVTTVYNNDHDNTAGMGAGTDKEYVESYEGRLIDAKGAKGRYIRFISKGNTTDAANHYIEVEVYGAPAA